MGKSTDKGNTTMPLSDSQVVAVTPAVSKNDQSAWKGLVVSGDDFAPAAPKSHVRRWLILGVLGVGAGAGGIYAFERGSSDERAPPQAATVAPPSADAAAMQPAAIVAPPSDATVATAPIDAAPAPIDAAPVEAIQQLAPKKNPVVTKKKPTLKKHVH